MWWIPCVLALAIAEPEPLAGPKVETRPTAITFGMSGEMVRETLRVEEAVIRRLRLSPASSAAVERVLNQRGRSLVRYILGHIDLLNRLNVTQSSGDSLATGLLLWEALGRLEHTGFRGDLAACFREVLTPEEQRAFDRALDAHWSAFAAAKLGKNAVTRGEIYAARAEETLQSFAKELEAAFQRAERSGEFVVAYLLDGLGLTGRQRERIDAVILPRLEALAEDAPESERIALLLGVLAYLSPEQQERLMKKLKGE